MVKRVCFPTFSRSDYASVQPVAVAADEDTDLDVKVLVGGSHCLKRFGETIRQVREDNYSAMEAVPFLNEADDTDADLAIAFSKAITSIVDSLRTDQPDLVFLLGDRWEMLAAANAAAMLRIPIVHHSGGDITQGSADNQMRYAISALSHLHCVALPEHKVRLEKSGEESWRIKVTGEPALAKLTSFSSVVPDVRKELGLKHNEPFALATFHPTTHSEISLDRQISCFVEAIKLIDIAVVMTAPNPDPGSGEFLNVLKDFADSYQGVSLFNSLGTDLYYSAMSEANFMIGNSSSGIWEAPSFNLPVINMGSRQDGRVRGDNVIDVSLDIGEVQAALSRISDETFLAQVRDSNNPYVQDDTVAKILDCLKTPMDKAKILAKKFVDRD